MISLAPTIILCSLLKVSAASINTSPRVSLDYWNFQGKYDPTYNLSYFRKIPFAAPPTGENRFRAPQPLFRIDDDVYNTDQDFDMCPQRTVNGSEDCLYLGLFSRPWAASSSFIPRPVLVVFYGGAFIQGSASFTIPPSSYPILNASALNDYIVIYPNYRVNAFGFLPGKAIKDSPTSDLNPGLLDQQYALKWVQKYIHHFGGDPHNVSIWGQSAGAGSVVAQTCSPFWPKTYKYDDPEAEDIIYSACALDWSIRNASLTLSNSQRWTTSSYTWAPVIDGEFLTETLTDATNRKLTTEFIFGMYNTHEGENFIPPGLNTPTGSGGFNSSILSFQNWLAGFVPGLSSPEIESIESYYPATGETEMISYNSTYVRAGLVYRDLVLACPAYWLAMAAGSNGYLGEYTISPAKHASDTIYWNQINPIQESNPDIYKGYAGAFASFFQIGDPNAHKLTDASQPGVPDLPTGKEFVATESGFENVEVESLKKRCGFWREVGKSIPI